MRPLNLLCPCPKALQIHPARADSLGRHAGNRGWVSGIWAVPIVFMSSQILIKW